MLKKIQETASYLKKRFDNLPHIGIILGTGLGNLVTQLTQKVEIQNDIIPNFPVSTVEGHQGKLIIGVRWRRCVGDARTISLLRI